MTITSSHTQDHGAATAPPQRTSRVAITPERAAALHTGYTATLATAAAGAVSVLRDPDKLDARVRVLRATLSSLGIEDITNLGRMQLDKTVHVRPGLRRPGGSEETSAKPGSVLDVDEAIMPATEFVLADDTELRLAPEIRHLTILAVSMDVGRRCTVTWQPATRQPRDRAVNGATAKSYSPTDQTSASAYYSPAGGDGGPGEPGAKGDTGQDGPTVEIWALQANRLPTFHLAGGRGGDGGAGGSGAHGGHGAKGLEADANLFKCVRQVGYGGDGGDGGAAGDGGDGGRGGRGGDVTLYLSDATHESVLGAGLRTDLTGGPGGAPSVPGAPGLPGIGGEAGNDKPPACLG